MVTVEVKMLNFCGLPLNVSIFTMANNIVILYLFAEYI